MADEPQRRFSKIDVRVRATRPSTPDLFDLLNELDTTVIGIADVPERPSDVEKDARRGDSVAFTKALPTRAQWVHVIDPWGWQESAFVSKRLPELDRALEIGAV